MSVRPLDFWESAKQSFTGATKEVDYRNTSSRTYYSAYHVAVSTADKNTYHGVSSIGGTHEAIIKCLQNLPKGHRHETLARSAGALLGQMRKNRIHADYTIAQDYTKDDAELQLETFNKFMEKISEIGKLP